jgi:parallel beta-helix repeat protein
VSKSTFVTISQDHVSYSGLPTPGATAAGIQVNGGSDSLIARNTVDHNTVAGIYLTNGSTRITVDENLASWNAFGYVRNAPGIDVRTAGNTVLRNISHDNEDSGLQFYPGANDNLVAGNVSYHNKGFTEVQLTNCNHPKTGDTGGCITGDHGIDDLNVTGNTLIGNSIYDNVSAGINVEGTSGNFLIANNVSVDNAINCPNGAGGTEKCPRTAGNIRVDQDSTVGTTLHQDLVYLHLAAGQTGTMMTWKTSGYATLAAFETVSGQEQSGLEADPLWLAPGAGNLRLAAGSPAIDSADSAVGGELTSDIDGTPRTDDPATPNTGAGPRTYDDRGAYEFGAGPATVPGAPVAVASADTSSVQLSWTAPADGGSPIIGYDVYRATTPGGEGASPVAQLGVVSSYQDGAVTSGTTYYYQVTALNSVGEGARSAEVNASLTSAANLVGNPGFEVNVSGWGAGSGNSLVRVTTAHTGSGAAAVTLATAGNDTLLNDSPDWNKQTFAGTTCTATAWVQGPSGLKAFVRLREYHGTTLVAYVTGTVTLQGATWVQVTVPMPVINPGDTVDVNVYGKSFAVGQALLVDDVSEVCQ